MQPFTSLTAVACPLGLENVDTDQLIPARFMSRARDAGYGAYLLHDLRFDAAGAVKAGFLLNDTRYRDCRVLVAHRNFGTGSSREAAVYALADFGVRCVIAPSFGDIFASNAVKNGMLPAAVEEAAVGRLLRWLAAAPEPVITVDLERQIIQAGSIEEAFAIDPVRRRQLINGWDDIDLTASYLETISAFKRRRRADAPWAWPNTSADTGAQ
jgi:3-isopropylmalate/(R)-2-methylmalate dehydratase small subunit